MPQACEGHGDHGLDGVRGATPCSEMSVCIDGPAASEGGLRTEVSGMGVCVRGRGWGVTPAGDLRGGRGCPCAAVWSGRGRTVLGL